MSAEPLRIRRCIGRDILPHIPELARLRIQVFRDFPYLYDGDLAYEESYLADYASASGALLVLALDGDRIVGATTGMPLPQAHEEFIAPFRGAGIPAEQVFYFGESVLAPSHRGRGLGHVFFDEREAHARTLPGVRMTAFCAVERPEYHPLRPAAYRPLDTFWSRRGYVKKPAMRTTFPWKDLGDAQETAKPMVFWLRDPL